MTAPRPHRRRTPPSLFPAPPSILLCHRCRRTPAMEGWRLCRTCYQATQGRTARPASADPARPGASTPASRTDAPPAAEYWISPEAGASVTGTVIRLPAPNIANGTYLYLRRDLGRTVGLHATSRRGHTVLERELHDQTVQVGDVIQVTFHGWRTTTGGERQYRDERVQIIQRRGQAAVS